MYSEEWIIVDTETSGLYPPVYVVEIAAQRMKGWHRDGEPFRVLLNHNVPIEPAAESLHGYSREYLRKHGELPQAAHEQFSNYCGDRPIVAYNLSYDWDRALYPEYERLQRPPVGKKGFCALTLARRTVKETLNYKLETLKEHFHLSIEQSHRGKIDVEVLTRLLQEIIGPRLYKAGVFGFDTVAEFSRRTPVAKCIELVLGAGDPVWYCLDGQNVKGPYTIPQIRSLAAANPIFVCREGMPQWVMSNELPEFAPVQRKNRGRKPKPPKVNTPSVEATNEALYKVHYERWVNETIGLCRGILADGIVTEREVKALEHWLTTCPCTHLYPLNLIGEKLEAILCDGVLSEEELLHLKDELELLMPVDMN